MTTLQMIQELRESLPRVVRDSEFLSDQDLAALASGLKGLQRYADALQAESDKRSQALPYSNFGEMEAEPPMTQIEQLARLNEYATRR